MVQTFRDEFASVIRTNGGTVAGLNEALRKKIAQASAS
jgi:ABC-type transporter MlaC component